MREYPHGVPIGTYCTLQCSKFYYRIARMFRGVNLSRIGYLHIHNLYGRGLFIVRTYVHLYFPTKIIFPGNAQEIQQVHLLGFTRLQ